MSIHVVTASKQQYKQAVVGYMSNITEHLYTIHPVINLLLYIGIFLINFANKSTQTPVTSYNIKAQTSEQSLSL